MTLLMSSLFIILGGKNVGINSAEIIMEVYILMLQLRVPNF